MAGYAMGEAMELMLVLAGDGLDESELDTLTRQLLAEVRASDVESAHLPRRSEGPGLKGPIEELGVLVVSVLPSALPRLIALLQVWTNRRPRHALKLRVRVQEGEIAIETSGEAMSAEQIGQLVARLTKSLGQAGKERSAH